MSHAPLLSWLQGTLERTHGLQTGIGDASAFVIGDEGLARLYAGDRAEGRDLARPGEAMLLVRSRDGEHRVRLYYPDGLIANLERHDPRRGLRPENLHDFAIFIEELDHLLVLASAARWERSVTGFELELHANVSKALVTSLFLARSQGVARLDEEQRQALYHELFERGDYGTEEDWLRVRYRDARRHALRFLARLRRTARRERARLLHRFSHASLSDQLALCA